jgi:hypothetical protein
VALATGPRANCLLSTHRPPIARPPAMALRKAKGRPRDPSDDLESHGPRYKIDRSYIDP